MTAIAILSFADTCAATLPSLIEGAIQVLEDRRRRARGAPRRRPVAVAMPAIRVPMPAASARPNLPSLRSMSCTISAIGRSAGSSRPCPGEQHLEGAAVALVGELGLEHVEAQLAGLGLVALRGDELEARLRVDEAPDQPGRADAVDVHPAPRHPGRS